jgi:hypothetical protein
MPISGCGGTATVHQAISTTTRQGRFRGSVPVGPMTAALAAALTVCVVGPLRSQEQPGVVVRVAWLQGCWEAASAQRTVEEQWMAPRGGSMLGMSRTVRGGRLAGHELIVLRGERDRLAYEAHPSGQSATVFLSTTVSDTLALFENPEHDFPQRVGYRRVGTDSLLAWIDGTVGGEARMVEFRFARVACGGP